MIPSRVSSSYRTWSDDGKKRKSRPYGLKFTLEKSRLKKYARNRPDHYEAASETSRFGPSVRAAVIDALWERLRGMAVCKHISVSRAEPPPHSEKSTMALMTFLSRNVFRFFFFLLIYPPYARHYFLEIIPLALLIPALDTLFFSFDNSSGSSLKFNFLDTNFIHGLWFEWNSLFIRFPRNKE